MQLIHLASISVTHLIRINFLPRILHKALNLHCRSFDTWFLMQAIATSFTVETEVALPGWVGVAGAVICMFAFLVPTLHALRFISTCSLLFSCTYTFIGTGVAFSDGTCKITPIDLPLSLRINMLQAWSIHWCVHKIRLTAGFRANGPRDYSLKGSNTAKTFNAMGAVAITAFAFNSGILPEMQVYLRFLSLKISHLLPPHILNVGTTRDKNSKKFRKIAIY